MTDLPPLNCAGCRKCCQGGNAATLRPERGDDVTRYVTRRGSDGERVLKTRKNGDCIYLGSTGCSIYARRPYECRTLDCRTYFLGLEPDGIALGARLSSPARETVLEGRRRVREMRAAQG